MRVQPRRFPGLVPSTTILLCADEVIEVKRRNLLVSTSGTHSGQRRTLNPAVQRRLVCYRLDGSKGGHFAAWEQPQLFSEEVRAGLRPRRKSI
jgi:hypothetical protein